tara:strand:+ start:48 stop:326 length:279 start_codon:yes stop_codon:yes gene_type:complete
MIKANGTIIKIPLEPVNKEIIRNMLIIKISIRLYLLIVINTIAKPIELNDASILGFQIRPLYLPEKKSKLPSKQTNISTNKKNERCLKKFVL